MSTAWKEQCIQMPYFKAAARGRENKSIFKQQNQTVSPMQAPSFLQNNLILLSPLPTPGTRHSSASRSRCEWRELVLADCVGFASLFSAWARDSSWATSIFSCFSFFTVLATEWQYLPGPCRKVTFPKNKLKKNYKRKMTTENSLAERELSFFHSTSCCGDAA